ncbi:hypothetical protein P3570_22255 [Vibrio parahaemolyticus]|nr:hypothetical protein [Vibrio parahaemolyticus]MDG3424296.1 hypothetical protein [Vibrio parahaemolyticus]
MAIHTSLNDKARRAKNKSEIDNLSSDEVSVKYGFPRVWFVNGFEHWGAQHTEQNAEDVLNDLFLT